MTKQEEIKVSIYGIISDACHAVEEKNKQWSKDPNHFLIDYTNLMLNNLVRQGVVIKVGSDAPEITCYDKLGDEPETKVLYAATEPLIGEKT